MIVSTSRQSLIALLHRATQVATERFAAAVGDSDLTARQLQILDTIEAHDGPSQTDIVNVTGIDRSTVADIVRRLSKRKLIERKRSKDDARAYIVKLTVTGREALASGGPALGATEQGLLAALPVRQRSELLAMLGKVIASGEAAKVTKATPMTKHG